MQTVFRGRAKELAVLQKRYDAQGFQMVVLYGRRRIGKTTLMNEFLRRQKTQSISFTAVEQSEQVLIRMMSNAVLLSIAPELQGIVNFTSFEQIFEFVGQKASSERIIFFIDEYPYLAKQCPYIQSVLQKVIDQTWKQTKLFFVLCGSLVSFMKEDVIAESAPLYGRSNLEMKLRPFDYLQTAEFFQNYTYEEKAICYGLTGGVAKYIEQFDAEKPLEANIIEQFFEMGGYFTEEQVKTVVTGEKQNPALYNSILLAVATGHSKNNEIASFAGMKDVTYPLKVLVEAELLEKRSSGKPYYVIADNMLAFWFKYVSCATSLINAGRGEQYYISFVKDNLHDFMGTVFEQMAKDYLLSHAGAENVPLMTDISEYQNTILDENRKRKQLEIDLVGYRRKDIVLLGECKFKNEKFGKGELEVFTDKVKYMLANSPALFLFSLSGFTKYVEENAQNTVLVDIKEMYVEMDCAKF
jgi:uncharacterized protein